MSESSSSHERLTALLTHAQAHLQEGDLSEASACLEEALAHQESAATKDVAGRAATLERELRFAMGLMALLFFTGVWGFWRGALYERAPRRAASAAGPAAVGGSPAAPTPSAAVPRAAPRHIPPIPPRAAKISKRALMPSAVLKPSALRRPRYRRKKPGTRRKRSPIAPVRRRIILQPKARGLVRRRRKRRRRRWARRRRLRFGDPASASEVPRAWCGRRLRYGPYYPCLKRRRRRCIKRSKRRKYGCLRRRR